VLLDINSGDNTLLVITIYSIAKSQTWSIYKPVRMLE